MAVTGNSCTIKTAGAVIRLTPLRRDEMCFVLESQLFCEVASLIASYEEEAAVLEWGGLLVMQRRGK